MDTALVINKVLQVVPQETEVESYPIGGNSKQDVQKGQFKKSFIMIDYNTMNGLEVLVYPIQRWNILGNNGFWISSCPNSVILDKNDDSSDKIKPEDYNAPNIIYP